MFTHHKKAETKGESNAAPSKVAASPHPTRQPAWTNALGSQPALTLQPKLTVNQPGDEYEQEADQVASQVMRMPTPTVQRCACGGVAGPDGECAACKAKRLGLQRKPILTHSPMSTIQRQVENSSISINSLPGLIVEDDTADLKPGQMHKTDFLIQARDSACQAANEILASTNTTTDGCPLIARQFEYLVNRSGRQVERAVHLFALASLDVTSATEYIPIITERVRMSVGIWAQTGKITGVPENLAVFNDSENDDIASNENIQRKKRGDIQSYQQSTPEKIQSQLGEGSGLESSVKSRMESSFGEDFSDVRIHNDQTASSLSTQLNAYAFTVGKHIAFSSGEYAPNTIMGQALIAHELAHVIQQRGGSTSATNTGIESESLEHEANTSGIQAMMIGLWSKAKGTVANVMPRLRTGLKVQSCSRKVKRCPSGLTWQVAGLPTGAGPVCLCVWRCMPAPPNYRPPSDVSEIRCPPNVYCDRPSYETVGDEYKIERDGESVVGVGGHMTPMTGEAMCGCLPLDMEGEPTGAPLLPVGLQLTDLVPTREHSPETGVIDPTRPGRSSRGTVREETPPAIREPLSLGHEPVTPSRPATTPHEPPPPAPTRPSNAEPARSTGSTSSSGGGNPRASATTRSDREQGGSRGPQSLGPSLQRGTPRIEEGDLRSGWEHIDARHVTGNHPTGAGDLFPRGTTRAQLQEAAESVVRDGTRISDPGRRLQTYERKLVVNGQRDWVRVVVDTTDNHVITIFPVRGGN